MHVVVVLAGVTWSPGNFLPWVAMIGNFIFARVLLLAMIDLLRACR